ncbi:MAG: DUF1638 domain-containing protein [Anaerolineae bacterium]|jgi:hypothetical protein|nr:DUF1638 domain-containing protein [Chloroflexota bacterium]
MAANHATMRLKLIACEVLARQAYYVAALSPHVVDIELIDKGLHDESDRLRSCLQERIDAVPAGRYDAVLLGYGLCSNSTAGLRARDTQLVLARAHDCITLFLGSAERYGQEFRQTPGTYWYVADYIERGNSDSTRTVALGAAMDDGSMQATYDEYVAKYGKDNAEYLMEVMGAWQKHYSRAAYIENADMPMPDYRPVVRAQAERRSWTFEQLEGRLLLVRDLIEGRWDSDSFLVVPPGHTIVPTFDARVVCASVE